MRPAHEMRAGWDPYNRPYLNPDLPISQTEIGSNIATEGAEARSRLAQRVFPLGTVRAGPRPSPCRLNPRRELPLRPQKSSALQPRTHARRRRDRAGATRPPK